MKFLYIAIGSSFLAALPVLFFGFPVDGHDSPSQFNLYAAFSRQIWTGEIYPRWLIDMNAGFGSPVFFFYPPLAYYAATFFSFITGQPTTDAMIWQQLGFSAGLAVILSGIACYFWLKETTTAQTAFFGSLVYLIVPYHISTDLFTRGALAEVWAFVWMPLILKFVKTIYEKPAIGLIGLSLSYALLIMTHLPTALIFSLVPICYGLFLKTGQPRKVQLLLMVLGMGIGIGIADVYLIPALEARSYTAFEANPSSHLYYEKNFLLPFSADAYSPYILQLTVLLATVVAGILLCVAAEKGLRNMNGEQKFWLTISAVSVFLMTPLSSPIWALIPTLQSIQFPYRFNAVLCVAYAGLTAATLPNILSGKKFLDGDSGRKSFAYGTAVLCSLWLGFFVYSFVGKKPSEYQEYVDKMYNQKLDFVEHMPATARLDKLDELIGERQKSGSKNLLKTDDEKVRAETIQWKPRHIELKTDAAEAGNLVVGQFYYPGWKAFYHPDSSSTPVALPVEHSEKGLVSVEIPQGAGRLELDLTNRAEKSGLTTSIASLAGMFLLAFGLNAFKRKFPKEETEIENG